MGLSESKKQVKKGISIENNSHRKQTRMCLAVNWWCYVSVAWVQNTVMLLFDHTVNEACRKGTELDTENNVNSLSVDDLHHCRLPDCVYYVFVWILAVPAGLEFYSLRASCVESVQTQWPLEISEHLKVPIYFIFIFWLETWCHLFKKKLRVLLFFKAILLLRNIFLIW